MMDWLQAGIHNRTLKPHTARRTEAKQALQKQCSAHGIYTAWYNANSDVKARGSASWAGGNIE